MLLNENDVAAQPIRGMGGFLPSSKLASSSLNLILVSGRLPIFLLFSLFISILLYVVVFPNWRGPHFSAILEITYISLKCILLFSIHYDFQHNYSC